MRHRAPSCGMRPLHAARLSLSARRCMRLPPPSMHAPHRAQPQLGARPEDSDRDLPAVGAQDLLERHLTGVRDLQAGSIGRRLSAAAPAPGTAGSGARKRGGPADERCRGGHGCGPGPRTSSPSWWDSCEQQASARRRGEPSGCTEARRPAAEAATVGSRGARRDAGAGGATTARPSAAADWCAGPRQGTAPTLPCSSRCILKAPGAGFRWRWLAERRPGTGAQSPEKPWSRNCA
jgi:hypothetical protein